MTTASFHEKILAEITKGLSQPGSLPELQKAAEAALNISKHFPIEIPPDEIARLATQFPKILGPMLHEVRGETSTDDQGEANELRKQIEAMNLETKNPFLKA